MLHAAHRHDVYEFDAAAPMREARALDDLWLGLARWRLAWALAVLDIRNRYRGSVLGPLWLTLSTAAMLTGLGLLYSTLFRVPLVQYLPHLAVSLIVWNMMAQMINEATDCLTSAESIIRQMPLPYTVHALRCVIRNAIVAAHNVPLIIVAFAICDHWPGAEAALVVVGIVLLGINAFAATLLLGALCARFRDIGQIVGSVVQLAFFLTPVLWKADLLTGTARTLLPLNPFYAMIETIRGPLIEGGGALAAWLAAVFYTVLLVSFAAVFFIRFRGRVAFWA